MIAKTDNVPLSIRRGKYAWECGGMSLFVFAEIPSGGSTVQRKNRVAENTW